MVVAVHGSVGAVTSGVGTRACGRVHTRVKSYLALVAYNSTGSNSCVIAWHHARWYGGEGYQVHTVRWPVRKSAVLLASVEGERRHLRRSPRNLRDLALHRQKIAVVVVVKTMS